MAGSHASYAVVVSPQYPADYRVDCFWTDWHRSHDWVGKAGWQIASRANQTLNLTGAAFWFRAACRPCSGPGKLA